jgi:molecular chaperone GrpE
LTPERIETVLADFRTWLQEAVCLSAEASAEPIPSSSEHAKPIDLHTLVGQFLALRHEVHLLTRSARAQQEQTTQTQEQLGQALDAVRQSGRQARDDAESAESNQLRPLLKTLLDVEDALGLARREAQRVREVVLPGLDRLVAALEPPAPLPAESAAPPRPSFWARLFGGAGAPVASSAPAEAHVPDPSVAARQEQQRKVVQEAQQVRDWLESLVTGYTMSLQRLERTLRQSGLEPTSCTGEPFDPETMEAVEAATGTGLPAGQVLEEIRRGYRWRGRVFRYAQVRVAKS